MRQEELRCIVKVRCVMGIYLRSKGDFNKTEKFLKKSLGRDYIDVLKQYGRYGVQALASATPVDSGRTASSWTYDIEENRDGVSVIWSNTNINKGVNIALILQYGHGTGTGGYVQGLDYINPALRPIFEDLADKAWKEVISE